MAEPRSARSSPLQRRAMRLLVGGLVGAHSLGAGCVVAFAVAGPARAAAWSALAALTVILFFTIGQGVQVMVADADPRVVMVASVASFTGRAVGLAALLAWAGTNADRIASLDPVSVAVTAVVTVLGWLAGEIWVFTRLRIPSFDPPPQGRE